MNDGSPQSRSGLTAIRVEDLTAWLDRAGPGDRIVYATRNYRLRPGGGGPSAFVLFEASRLHDEGLLNLFQRRVGHPPQRGRWTDKYESGRAPESRSGVSPTFLGTWELIAERRRSSA